MATVLHTARCAGWKPEEAVWAGATDPGVGKGLLRVDRGGAAVDNKETSSSIVRGSFVMPLAAVVREARRGCCVMLEAQLAESSDSQE